MQGGGHTNCPALAPYRVAFLILSLIERAFPL